MRADTETACAKPEVKESRVTRTPCPPPGAPAPGVSYGVLEPCGDEARASERFVGRVGPATKQGPG
eukprot:11640257-Alexandrium_andersonii.AAC.1